jgi:hypothetical protein
MVFLFLLFSLIGEIYETINSLEFNGPNNILEKEKS